MTRLVADAGMKHSPEEDKNHKDIVSLREYFQVQINNLDRRIEEQRRDGEANIKLASQVMESRLEGMNEFRNQINMERASYVRQDELDLKITALRAEIRPAQDYKQQVSGGLFTIGLLISLGLGVMSLVVHFLKP